MLERKSQWRRGVVESGGWELATWQTEPFPAPWLAYAVWLFPFTPLSIDLQMGMVSTRWLNMGAMWMHPWYYRCDVTNNYVTIPIFHPLFSPSSRIFILFWSIRVSIFQKHYLYLFTVGSIKKFEVVGQFYSILGRKFVSVFWQANFLLNCKLCIVLEIACIKRFYQLGSLSVNNN